MSISVSSESFLNSLVLTRLDGERDVINAGLLREELSRFSEFFTAASGGKTLWSVQKTWMKRVLTGESFALIAPTGVGKSTLLQVYSLYVASRGRPALYIVPTKYLAEQTLRSLREFRVGGVQVNDSEALKSGVPLPEGRVDVLTHAFLHRRKASLSGSRYGLVVVDDFDALLKSSTLMNTILNLVGVSEESIKIAQKLVQAKREMMYFRYAGNVEKARELLNTVSELELNLSRSLNYVGMGQILIASATGRGRSERVKILRELLGFEVGSITDYLRNMVEVVEPLSSVRVEDLVRRLHRGTLLFVSKDLGVGKARELAASLSSAGVKALLAGSRRALEKLRDGRVDALVGVSTYYGILTRGLDEPLHIYNTVFYGLPKFDMDLESTLLNPLTLVRVLRELPAHGYALGEEDRQLVARISSLRPGALKVLSQGLRGGLELEGFLRELSLEVLKAKERVEGRINELLERGGGRLSLSFCVIKRAGGRTAVLLPDVMTYLQASGRSSRLYGGHMTLGLSILLYEDEDLLRIFQRKLHYLLPSYSPVRLGDVDLERVASDQALSRLGGVGESVLDRIKSVLMVVESPTKARTIARMFGTPGKRFVGNYVMYETVIAYDGKVYLATVAPSMGHVLDLVTDEGLHGVVLKGSAIHPVYTTIKRCAGCGHQFTEESQTCPRCGSVRVRDSRKVLEALKKIAREVDEVYIATDPDDEGEKIAYDLYTVLKPVNSRVKRVEFHEITRQALMKALNSPRDVDLLRVSAQVVRRVDDRLIGFELSKILQEGLAKHWLGGGRVQTPVLRWVVERYLEYESSKGFLVKVQLPNGLKISYFTPSREEAEKAARDVEESGVTLEVLETYEREVNPPPPYTTDTLLTDMVRELRVSPTAAMKIAQELFESGHITYHRTDSTHVSGVGIEVARDYVEKAGLLNLFTPRPWGGEGTHECIRPTKPLESLDESEFLFMNNLTYLHRRAYQMVFKRFVASQLRPSRILYARLNALLGEGQVRVEVPLKVLSEGFTRVAPVRTYEDLTAAAKHVVRPVSVDVVKTSRVPLLTAADVVRMMKDHGIGRPSTYAKAVENNVRHGYVILSKRRQFLIPTKTGFEVLKFIQDRYELLTSVEFTRGLETLVGSIKSGRISIETALTYLLSELIALKTINNVVTNWGEGLPQETG